MYAWRTFNRLQNEAFWLCFTRMEGSESQQRLWETTVLRGIRTKASVVGKTSEWNPIDRDTNEGIDRNRAPTSPGVGPWSSLGAKPLPTATFRHKKRPLSFPFARRREEGKLTHSEVLAVERTQKATSKKRGKSKRK